MCGFIVSSLPVERSVFETVLDLAAHRGPDSRGVLSCGRLLFGFNRLSIIDLDSRSDQPMRSEDGRYVLVYNGEIYNFKEIRRQLIERGVAFVTSSDTEVLLRYLILDGERCIKHLNGMFAFFFYDSLLDRAIVARDRMGVKPLYFYNGPEGFVFASEARGVAALAQAAAGVNDEAIREYLKFRFVSGGKSFFDSVRTFPNGSCSIVENSSIATRPFIARKTDHRETDASKVEALLLAALERELVADVPVGFFLSGGVDSSLLVCLASKALRKRVDSYSVALEGSRFSEKPFQDIVAKDAGTVHHRFFSDNTNYLEDFLYVCSKADSPPTIPNCIPIFQLARMAKRDVKVLITGEGSDEVFGGYGRFADARVKAMARKFGLLGLLSTLARVKPGLRRFLSGDTVQEFYSAMTSYAPDDALKMFTRLEPYARSGPAVDDDFNVLLEYDQETYLHGLLQRVDNMTMLAGIEARVPFLDDELVSYVNSMPFEAKVGLRQPKRIIYQIAEKYVPESILRRPKIGFHLPLEEWFSSETGLGRLKYILLDETSTRRGWYRVDRLRSAFSSPETIREIAHSTIFPLLSLELWMRLSVEGERPHAYSA